ncbi:MAG: hypothetical protein E7351_01865 [Clostridiales bacterium]|nr:hypothetical protein [Clostridiales bacterium]
MTRNDYFFKILFAIEIALLPMVIFSYILLPSWTVGLFIAGVLVAKIWLELFKEKERFSHAVIMAIGNILTISTLTILFTVYQYINIVLCVFVMIFVVLMNLLKIAMFHIHLVDTIYAVDYCYMLFECLALVAMIFIVVNTLATNIALIAILMTAVVSVVYKVYYAIRYMGVLSGIKELFRKRK